MKIESDGTQIRGYQSLNGTDWTLVGRPADLPTGTVRVGVFSLGNAAATAVTSEFDWFTLTTPGGGSGGAGDEFNGTSLDKTRWNAIQREDTSLYTRRQRRPDDDDGPGGRRLRPTTATTSSRRRTTRRRTTCSRPSSRRGRSSASTARPGS